MLYTKTFIGGEIYPPLLAKLSLVAEECLKQGKSYWATSGLRSWEEQDGLYALGRTKKNTDATKEKPMGGIVTNARGGQSYHNFGLAVDFALDKDVARPGLQPDWNFASYKVLGHVAQAHGLEAGYFWKKFPDAPHIQLPISKVGLSLVDLQKLYHSGGMKLVWATLDKYNW